MRRIFLTMAHYPSVPDFDFYVNFPTGALVNWPGGFDLLLATLSMALGEADPSPLFVERVCATSIPFLGTLTVGAFFFICRHFLPFAQSLFASFLLAVSGAHILVSRIGRVDHHVMEQLVPALALWAYLAALDRPFKSRAWILLSLLSGALFGLSHVFWTGSVMFLGMFLLYAFSYQAFLVRKQRQEDLFSKRNGLVLLSAAIVLLPFCALSPWGKQGKVLYVALSWFHFLVPFFGCLMLFVLDRLRSSLIKFRRGLLLYILSAGLLALLLFLLTVLIQPQTLHTLRDTWEFVTRKEVQIHSLGESRSLWVVTPLERILFYGHLAFLLPFTALYAVTRSLWPKERGPKNLILLFWFLCTGMLAALQVRFTPAFSLPLCLVWGLLFMDLQRCAAWLGAKRERTKLYRWIPFPLYLVFALATFPNALNQPAQSIPRDHYDAFVDIGRTTPETAFCWEPDKKPDYGILSHWPYGHHLNYISHRPNIANPFGQAAWYLRGVQDSYRFFLSETEQEADSLCKRLEARYVLASSMSRHFSIFARYVSFLTPDRLKGAEPKDYLKRHYGCVMNNRMLLHDGLAAPSSSTCEDTGPLSHFRLVYESPAQEKDRITGEQTSAFKLYEQVQGVHLTGKASPGQPVKVSVNVQTNLNRQFTYEKDLRADGKGFFETFLPYATQGSASPCHALGPYRIEHSEKEIHVDILEQDVQEGKEIFLELT